MPARSRNLGAQAIAGAVLVAAGLGKRLGAGMPKANVRLAGLPMLEWPLHCLASEPLIGAIALVVHSSDLRARTAWVRGLHLDKQIEVVPGGAQRQHSVARGLAALASSWSILLVHDAARPLLKASLLRQCILKAEVCGGAVAAVPVKDSIKLIQGGRLRALPRERLWVAQTPQAFRADLLRRAYSWARRSGKLFTDEAALLEARGFRAAAVPSYDENMKVTTPRDLCLARMLIRRFHFRD